MKFCASLLLPRRKKIDNSEITSSLQFREKDNFIGVCYFGHRRRSSFPSDLLERLDAVLQTLGNLQGWIVLSKFYKFERNENNISGHH